MTGMQLAFAAVALCMAMAGLLWVLGPLRQMHRAAVGTAAALVPLLATGMYLSLGAPKAIDAAALAPQHTDVGELQTRVARLEARLQAQPQDIEGWFMLARSHQVLEQWEPASAAYRRALALAPEDADLLADLADVLGVIAQGDLEGEPRTLLERAVASDPVHAKSLLLLAAADFRQGRMQQAQGRWELLLKAAPDSPAARVAREGLARIEAAAGGAKPALRP